MVKKSIYGVESNMKIAIMLSTYNGKRYLREQLDSIMNQDIDAQVVLYIRDDNSNDETEEIVSKYSKKMQINFWHRKNVGPAKSFWELFMNGDIQADYYAFCDQDDIWDANKLQKAIISLEKFENCAALWCSNCRLIDSSGKLLEEKMQKEKIELSLISQIVCGTIQGAAMVFNNRLREYVYNKNIEEFPMHDFVLITYALSCGRVIYDEEPSFSYRIHENNVVASGGKSLFSRLKSSYYRWFSKQHRYENSKFAERILIDNKEYLDEETIKYLNCVAHCKYNIINRYRILVNPLTKAQNKKAERSFKIRVLLGII